MSRGSSGADIDRQIETSLRNAIKLNPSFAPAYDRLAVFYAMHGRNLDQAHMLTLQAVQLDSGNVGFRINAAKVLVALQRKDDATNVLQVAMKLAKTPQDVLTVQDALEAVRQRQSARERNVKEVRQFHEAMASAKDYQPEDVGVPYQNVVRV